MKKLLMIFLCLTLCGCEIGTVDDRLMVYAIGIDVIDEQYEVSYQVFTPKGESQSAPVNVDDKNVSVISVKGETLGECREQLKSQTGKDIFTKDTEVIVMGESVTADRAVEIIDYCTASGEIYIGCSVCFCEGEAKDAVNIGKAGTKDPHSLGEILRVAYSGGKSPSPRLVELYNRLRWSGRVSVSVLGIEKDGEDNPYPTGVKSQKMIMR